MRIIAIGDTHNKHEALEVPKGDLLIHTGDFTQGGTKRESLQFFDWFAEQPHPYKILVPGNHDYFLEKSVSQTIRTLLPDNIAYLQDSGIVIDGIAFWGSGVVPGMPHGAFCRSRGRAIRKHWEMIPPETRVLVTHTPPYGIKDQGPQGNPLGCEELFKSLQHLGILAHFFGHIHENYGITRIGQTSFINTSVLDEKHRLIYPPVTFNLQRNKYEISP